ncbi:toxin-antitoxin system HicB family antitoxin [Thermus scotoductus]|uniref:Toxin-antitoxin system HicB family antitoxin n=1 Tax=Thermus scotoductus TaxID=37636 RepID=A0A430S803_THESC|nr:toxin-antitoxin system HicB family antitoxin [Thermus scotoductus]RTH31776.1 toxin-antitoxin system HicB family antitoxin [Thermus scotoductus]
MKRRNLRQRKPLEYYLNLKYPVLLVPEPEGGFTALIPDLPGCVSVGETEEEALRNVEEARQLWLETAYEFGDEIPLPSSEREYSGRILVRMPKSLHRRLAEEAEAEGVSLNQYIVSLLSERSTVKSLLTALSNLTEESSRSGWSTSGGWARQDRISLPGPIKRTPHETLPVA